MVLRVAWVSVLVEDGDGVRLHVLVCEVVQVSFCDRVGERVAAERVREPVVEGLIVMFTECDSVRSTDVVTFGAAEGVRDSVGVFAVLDRDVENELVRVWLGFEFVLETDVLTVNDGTERDLDAEKEDEDDRLVVRFVVLLGLCVGDALEEFETVCRLVRVPLGDEL